MLQTKEALKVQMKVPMTFDCSHESLSKLFMSFSKSLVSIPFNFALPSVLSHMITIKFCSKTYPFDKTSPLKYNFSDF